MMLEWHPNDDEQSAYMTQSLSNGTLIEYHLQGWKTSCLDLR